MSTDRARRWKRLGWALGALALFALAGWLTEHVSWQEGRGGKLDGLVDLLTLRFIFRGYGTLLKGLGLVVAWLVAFVVAMKALFGRME